MPLLASSLNPPASTTLPVANTISSASSAKTPGAVMSPNLDSERKSPHPVSTVSRVPLDVDNISAQIASDLAVELISHVLFLKNQIPFPVMQLSRIPNGKSNPRALKLRTNLLSSFDILSSHLNTTFTALSTAFALVASGSGRGSRPTRRAYLAILIGPSIGSAKTRVMFAVDGFVAKVWGERDDVVEESDDGEDSESDEDEGKDDDDTEEDSDSSTESDIASSPPPSRSPSPSPCTSPSPIPPPGPSPQQILRTATRLLGHTLATAKHSLSAELAPSQTHILVRAPRRFTHPAWIPRQTASAALDSVLREFHEEAGEGDATAATSTKPRRKTGSKVEGAWVTCRSPGIEFDDAAEAEEDEMIWWSWDGNIVGFADW
ncbi:hypothetical protein C8F04DRAFT_1111796 [Mycena alexandri]|uniref:Uncharacterized protein n=1 Tax=Mycena alexandri TaxID=1745969 RepID=A0AAD6RXG2_9AGAR|nr:hypothetical protein C8F04DRAFT_1159341 [Mycena alexandri]KAJ7031164.1 hypothetical protein C8F04DRAFT_1111796 [Mycena alexandri]